MLNEPTKEELAKLPKLYTNDADENVPSVDEAIIYMRFFLGHSEFFAAEFDGEDLFNGLSHIDDPLNPQWGLFSLKELKEIKVNVLFEIERDLNWKPKKFAEVRLEREQWVKSGQWQYLRTEE